MQSKQGIYMKTLDQVRIDLREELNLQGIPMTEWARQKGVDGQALQDFLRGKSKGRFGKAHKIACALGMKEIKQSCTGESAGLDVTESIFSQADVTCAG